MLGAVAARDPAGIEHMNFVPCPGQADIEKPPAFALRFRSSAGGSLRQNLEVEPHHNYNIVFASLGRVQR